MDLDFNSTFRIITGICLLIAWYRISERTAERWKSMTRVGRRLWMGYYVFLFAGVWGTIDNLNADAPITSKNYVFLSATIFLMVAALIRLEGDESTEPVYRVNLKGSPTKWYIQKLR